MRGRTSTRKPTQTFGFTIWRSKCRCSPRKSYLSTASRTWTASSRRTWSTRETSLTTSLLNLALSKKNSSRGNQSRGSSISKATTSANRSTKCGRQSIYFIATHSSNKPTHKSQRSVAFAHCAKTRQRLNLLPKSFIGARTAKKCHINKTIPVNAKTKTRTTIWWHCWLRRLKGLSLKR